jgi:hypothetical protein
VVVEAVVLDDGLLLLREDGADADANTDADPNADTDTGLQLRRDTIRPGCGADSIKHLFSSVGEKSCFFKFY